MNHYYTSFLNFYNLKNTHKLNVHFKAKSRKTSHKSNTFIILLLICFGFVFNGFSQSILINPNTNGGFENGTTFASNGWIAVNSTTDSWQVGNVPIASSGNRCAFMSSNAGTNWDYSQFNTVTHLYKNITIPPGEGRVALSFKWKANGEGTAASDFDNLKVFLAASNYNVTNNQVFNQTQLSGLGATNGMYKLNNATWNTENIVFQATPGVTYKLIFSWKSDNTIIANPPAALDDISVTTSPLGNYSSITSGPWSSPATWNTGIVPTGLDNATISSGHTVTIDDVNQAVNNLIINGVLNYGTVPSFFNVNNFLLINGGGLFNVFDGSVGKSLVVSGNITNNGTMNVSVGATTDGNLTLNGSTVQTVSGSGTFNSNVIRNLTFSNTNTTTPNVYWLVNNVKVAYNLNLTGARINLGTNKMIFGNNASGNTLTAPNGTGFLPSGKFSRWWTSTATGSAVTANVDPTTTTSRYPFIAANGDSRAMYISRTNATAAVAGELAVTYNDATSITQNLSVSDAGYQITERFNGNWLVSNEGTSVSSSSYRIVLIAQNALATSNGNVRVMNANAPLGGNHQSGTSTPGAQRINVSQTDLLAAPLYIGINSSDLPFISIASGNWNSPATWNKNTVPSCTDVVTISAGTAVTINSSGNSSKIINILETGQLSVTSGDLTIGCTLNNNSLINQGTLSVSGGMLNINGNFSNIATASFNQSGGTIVVDGNNNGLTSSSVLTGTPLVHIIATTPANLSLTGGTLQIIDPHVGNALANYALLISQGGGSNLANPNHTVAFGNGISTNSGGNANGFQMNLSDGLSNFTLGSVTVDALNGTNRFVKTLSNIGMLGNLSIISGEYRVSSPTYIAGNISNNGTLTSLATLNLATWSNNVGSASDNMQVISGLGTFRNSLTTSTASFINLTVNNINSSGVTLTVPLSVSGTLNIVSGIINTTNSSVLTLGTATSMGVFQGTPGPNTMISGPFARTISNLNSENILFPVGKVNAMPVAIAPKTTSVSVFKIEAFNTNTGTIDASINSLANKRWEISKVSGAFSTIDVQLTENSISSNSILVQAASFNGIYGSAFGSTATFNSGPPPSIQSDLPLFASNFTGFISYAKANPCSGTPLPGATLATQSTICFGQSVTLSLQNMTAGTGISYVWKTSTDGTNYSIVPNANTAILTVLPSQTSYYFAEVICINGGIMGSSTPVQITFSNNVSSISNGIRCGIGSVTLSATPSTGAIISWYANPVGGIELASGTTFETPSIASTTTYYASANTNSSAGNATIGTGTELTNTTSQNSVFCNYWANGWRQIVYTAQELNAAGLSAGSITSLTFNIASLPSPATVNNFAIRIGSTTNTSLSSFRNTDLNLVFGPNNYTPILGLNIITLANPYLWDGISNILIDIREDGQFASANSATYVTTTTTNTVIHGFSPNGATLNPSYYTSNPAATASNTRPNITFSGQAICSSPRVPVVATINVAPTVALNEVTQTICSGSTSNVVTLTSNPEDFNTYVWTPSTGVSGNQTVGWTFNPILSTSYTLTATQTSGSLCASNTTLEVIVNEIPSAINFTNTPPQICKDEITVLNVTGGTLASVEILNQNFNSPSNNWTTINASSGGTVGNATWTLRPNGHLGMNSNDNSQFYLSNSDSQGSGSITNTYLESPSFSTLNFSTVGLKFFHYYRNYSSTAKLQYSVNDGSWVDFKSYTTADVGTATNFSQENIQLPLAATNQANVKIRFYYNASWGYYWAIDNVTLTGTQFPNITWSPASNLYTDVAATVPYIGGTSATTLYFKSNTSGNATVTASTATALGCSVYKSINVNVKPSPTLVITNPVINCNGGTVDLTNPTIISGSTNIATLDFYSNAAATIPLDFPTNVTIGTYYFKATSSGGCTTIAPVTVTQTPALNVLITNSTSVTCNGLQNGSATAAASGGTAPYTYSWSNGTNGATATGLAVNTYTVTTTDAKGCTATKSITITQPTILTVTINPQGSILCNGGTGSSTTAIANGGTAPYTYLWSNGASTPTITSLVAGTYTCIVTDANGCSKTNAITITQPTALSATITNPINVSCNGGFDGGATISTTGGTAPYTYLWSNGATTASVSGLSTGQFTVTVFDANGCSVTKSVTITAPTPIVGLISSKTDVTCNGLTNGTATASASGGTAPYSYLWSFGPSTATISGIGAGTRTVIITDAKGCTTAVSVTINQPAVLIANTTTTNVGCNGSATGTATISATGGTAPYTYLWSTGATNTTINNLGIGTYTVTVTDAKGCTTTTEATVNGPTPLLAIATTTNLSCTAATATASVTVTGGTSPYTYLWNNGATTATISGLSAGIFTVTILDANGCTATASTTVYSFVPLVATASATPIACNGAATGTASVSVTGGTGPYTYLWNNGGTAATIPGLAEGSYSVTITDTNNCTATTSVNITAPALLVANVTATTIQCNGDATGTATISATGGTAPYTYLWNTGATTATINNLESGIYTVNVTDANNCSTNSSITITESSAIDIQFVTTEITCNNSTNGSVSVLVSGGASPYIYTWNTGAITPSITGIGAGIYTVTILDANGCISTSTVVVSEPSVLTASATSTNVSCAGTSNGSATVVANGGTAPYTYLWSNGSTSNEITSLISGIYTVTVIDSKGCITTNSVTISQETAVTLVITNPSSTCGNVVDITSPTITLGSDAGLTFTYFTDAAATMPLINPSSITTSGTYYIKGTAAEGCATTAPIIVEINTTPTPSGISVQDFTTGQTLADFTIIGQNIIWYTNATGMETLPITTLLVSGTTYYASQTLNGCESNTRLAITAGTDLKSPGFEIRNLRYYPNPVKDILTLQYSDTIDELHLFNMLGQLIFIMKTDSPKVQINMISMASGNYILQITAKGNSQNIKIIKE